ncbi:hypothetical protein GH5_03518 [Leishmania sp. Ghana 2012 LV757]|uniref:hypothetical protein n=1 Tax=Leishmania sp. Ghana 2012 LV757 TaxID=2803181 RepID=UPI001B6C3923|nr:hypothetical protein GH5_03518 [Leishmania sp. Ghana 2012 LV757]
MADLRAQLQDAEERARDVEAQQADREAEMADLRAQLQDAEERARDVEAQQADRGAEISDLRAQLQDAEERARDVAAQQADRGAEMADLRAQLQDAEGRARDVVCVIRRDGMRESEVSVGAEGMGVNRCCVAREVELEKAIEVIRRLREQVSEAQLRREALEAECLDIEQHVLAEVLSGECKVRGESRGKLSGSMTHGCEKSEVGDLRAQLQDAEERARDVAAQQADREAEISDLRAQLQDAEERARDVAAQQADREAEISDLRAQLQDAEERARDVEAQQADRDAEMADLRAQLQDAEERARGVEAQQAERSAKAFRLEELLLIVSEEESAKSGRWAALEREVAEAARCVQGLRKQLAEVQVGREVLVSECAGLPGLLGEEEDRREVSGTERESLLEQICELRFYDERTRKSVNGVAVATVHSVQLPGDDWGVVLQEHPEALEALVVDVSHACHVSRKDVEYVSFASGTLQATVRVRHDADVTESEMNRRLQEYDYPLTMELYALRQGPKRGADAALATVAQREREISRLNTRLSLLEDEASALRCAVEEGQGALRSVSRRVGERGSSFEGVGRCEGEETRNEKLADAREGDCVAVLTLSEETQRERLGRVMLEEALLLANTFTGLLVNAYGERLRAVERELKCTSMECTDTLDKLEELVRLLEGARAAEMAALRARDDYQQDLHTLQARYDLAIEEKQRLLLLVGEGREARDASVIPSWAECGIDGGSRLDCDDTCFSQRSRDGVGGGRSPPESSSRAVTPVGWQEQLEQLKREKEALMEELDAKSVSYNDALTLLNLHISQLMEELSMHLRGGEASASNARALLREISELRVTQGRTGALFEGGEKDGKH